MVLYFSYKVLSTQCMFKVQQYVSSPLISPQEHVGKKILNYYNDFFHLHGNSGIDISFIKL